MNIEEYIERIGFRGQLAINHECLKRLHRYHVMSIPFESLDVHLNREIKLNLESIYDKIILNNRGGFCYELNYLFYSFLTQIGFDCSMVSSRIFDNESWGPAFDHMSIIVKLENDWLVDVGFGNLFIEPLKIHADQHQEDYFKNYKISRLKGKTFLVSESLKNKNDFKEKYIFDLKARTIDEFVDQCNLKQYSPDSYFVKNTICTIATEFGRKTIKNNIYKVRHKNNIKETTIDSDADLLELLKKEFGVSIKNAAFAHR